MIFTSLWTLLIYCPVAHWVWHPNGWIFALGALDFAGGTVVHINAGVAGLICALVLGKRVGYGNEQHVAVQPGLPSSAPALLWVGWFGFNAGSAVGAGARAGMAMLATQVAAGAAALAWSSPNGSTKGKPSVLGAISGAVAGLVAITPATGFVAAGAGADHRRGRRPRRASGAPPRSRTSCGYDDSLDAFGVHGVGGSSAPCYGCLRLRRAVGHHGGAGRLSPGHFDQFISRWRRSPRSSPTPRSAPSSCSRSPMSSSVSGSPEEEEREGLDVTQHGERLA